MDIFLLALLLVSAVHGAKNGFAYTVKYFLLWFFCLVAGISGSSTVKELLIENTGIDEYVRDVLEQQSVHTDLWNFLPDACADWFRPSGSYDHEFLLSMESLILAILSFLLIVAGIRIVFALYLHLFSKKHNDGLRGFSDGVLGLVLGLVRGLFFILLIFVLFIPVISLVSADAGEFISRATEDSILAATFYNHNILLSFLI